MNSPGNLEESPKNVTDSSETKGNNTPGTPSDDPEKVPGGGRLDPEESGNFLENIPEEYKNKPYMKEINSVDGLMKQFDNAMKLIGKKPYSIPEETAAPEEWDNFYNKLGRPEKPEDYKINNSFEVEMGESGKEFDNDLKKIFHQAGLTSKQSNLLQDGYSGIVKKYIEKTQQDGKVQTEEFKIIFEQEYGDRKNEVLNRSRKILNQFTKENFKSQIETLDNNALMIMSGVLDNIYTKYIADDDLPNPQGISGSMLDIEKELIKIRENPNYINPGSSEYKYLRERDYELTKKKMGIQKKK
jgi:hypothetical protein